MINRRKNRRRMHMKTLHIYAQKVWHDEAYIAGTRDALHALRDAIDRALIRNAPAVAEAFCCDGEGYRIHVVPTTEEQADAMPVPYTDECARAQKDLEPFGPWSLIQSN